MKLFRPIILACALWLGDNSSILAQELQPQQNQKDALFFEAMRAKVMDDPQMEEQTLLQLTQSNPDMAVAWYKLAKVYMKQARIEKADEAITSALRADSSNIWYKQQYAEILAFQGKFADAAELYKSLAQTEKHNETYLFKSAMLFQKSGKYKEAIETLDVLQKNSSYTEDVLLEKQKIYLKMNDLDGAVKVAKELIAYMPDEGRYYSNLGDIYESNGMSDKARETYQDAIQKLPFDPSLQYGIAQFYKHQNDQDKYHQYMRKAIQNQGFDAETRMAIVRSYLDELSADPNRVRETIDVMKDMYKANPETPEVVALYGQVLVRNGEPAEGAAMFKKALALDPGMLVIWQELLFIYTDPQDADSLITYSKRAMRYYPDQAIIHFLNGIGHANKKDYKAALIAYNRSIDMQPENNKLLLSDMYAAVADVYHSLKQYSASDSCFRKALEYHPENATVLNNFSYYLSLRKQNLDEAAKMSLKSLDIRPGEPTFLDTYAWILFQQKKYKEAQSYMEQAIQAEENPSGVLFDHMGDILFHNGQVSEAVEYWKKAKENGSDNPKLDQKIVEKKFYE